MLNSLRSRYLLGALIAITLLIGLALLGNRFFRESIQYTDEIHYEHNELRRTLNALKWPLLGLESNLYLYVLLLTEDQAFRVPIYLDEIYFLVNDLKNSAKAIQSEALGNDVQRFLERMEQINKLTDAVLGMPPRQRYSVMPLIQDRLAPLQQEMLAYLQIALHETLTDDYNDRPEVYRVLREFRYSWAQYVSAVRLFVGARSGIFGDIEGNLQDMQQNIQEFYTVAMHHLSQLRTMDRQSRLDPVVAEAVMGMHRVGLAQQVIVDELSELLLSREWRYDLSLLSQKLQPAFEQAQNALTIIERRSEKLTAKNLRETNRVTELLRVFLWGSLLITLATVLGLYLVYEFWTRRPIVKVAKAMEVEGRLLTEVPLEPYRVKELDLLVDAFNLMQQQVRSRQQRITSILDNAADGIIAIDEEGRIETFNKAAERMFGYQQDEVIGRNVKILMPEPHHSRHDDYIQRYLHTRDARVIGYTRVVPGMRSNGEQFPMDLSIGTVTMGETTVFIGILADVSVRMADQLSLQQAKDDLEQNNLRLEESMRQLKATQKQLVESEKMASLGELVAGVAHEINTPVGVSVTAASHLQKESEDMLRQLESGALTRATLQDYGAEVAETLAILLNNLRRAADLISSFKQVAVDQTSQEVREFNLCGYLDEIILNLRPRLKKTEHRLQVDCPRDLTVRSVPGALSQVLTNLITNSLLHGYDEGVWGKISIVVRVVADRLTLEYRDDGRGMDAQTIEHIFDPFYTTRRGSGGSGLGMHISYNLVTQVLHGTIACQSAEGEGARFMIDMPLDTGKNG